MRRRVAWCRARGKHAARRQLWGSTVLVGSRALGMPRRAASSLPPLLLSQAGAQRCARPCPKYTAAGLPRLESWSRRPARSPRPLSTCGLVWSRVSLKPRGLLHPAASLVADGMMGSLACHASRTKPTHTPCPAPQYAGWAARRSRRRTSRLWPSHRPRGSARCVCVRCRAGVVVATCLQGGMEAGFSCRCLPLHPFVSTIRLPQFLDGRPDVPKLQLSKLPPLEDLGALAAAPMAEREPAARPVVPRLALSKLTPLGAAAAGAIGSGRHPGSGRQPRTARDAPAGECEVLLGFADFPVACCACPPTSFQSMLHPHLALRSLALHSPTKHLSTSSTGGRPRTV